METSIASKDRDTEDRAHPVGERRFSTMRIPSFTDPTKTYAVSVDELYCGCGHHTHTGATCRHLVLAEALLRARKTIVGRKLAEREVTELCERIFAPIKADTPETSFDLFLEALGSRHATRRMRERAFVRHHRTLMLSERKAA